jgi:dolichyl-diphosphooligosaccharide--protein glycosyltransferase/undecaprenyl-diphosphooligosaccharide--protein glycosyltransferase
LHLDNPRVPGLWDYGVVFFTTLFAKITSFSLETIILYMPALISSLVVIPMILIARLYGQTLWGFFAALLGAITWSYYNRTMTVYYDNDMFIAMAPMFILYFIMKRTIDFNLRSALYAALAIVLYPFMYDQGQAIVYAMGIIYGAYMVWFHRDEKTTYASLILVFLALMPLGLAKPMTYLVHIVLVLGVYALLRTDRFERKQLMIVSLILFLLFMIFGDVIGLIWRKIYSYVITGTQESGLHFYAVNQTVREAGKIPFATFANRISGSTPGLLIAAIGYGLLVWRKHAFILALPLVGIGIFANWGGLRFTVYAVPVAAMAAVYLFWYLAETFMVGKWARIGVVALATVALISPNITHIIGYRVPTVLSKPEVADLAKLNEIASSKDYTLTWWDYGYPVWYYSDTSTLIDGGKHDNDNFIVSTMLQTDSPKLAARLARLAVETYAKDPKHRVVSNVLFHNKQPDQKDPNLFLAELESGSIKLPPKTRDIYLYLPHKMIGIFPTVMVFGNLDLTTGKSKRKPMFYPTRIRSEQGGVVHLSNGIVLDLKKGTVQTGPQSMPLAQFVVAQVKQDGSVAVTQQAYRLDGKMIALYLKSYGQLIVMDTQTFNSTFVQMFMLGRYDSSLFEPVVSSPYSRIYRLKI